MKTDMTCCYECDNIKQLLKEINKSAVHGPTAQGIVFRDRGLIFPGVTGTLLLSQRGLITAEATESKHAIISPKKRTLLQAK